MQATRRPVVDVSCCRKIIFVLIKGCIGKVLPFIRATFQRASRHVVRAAVRPEWLVITRLRRDSGIGQMLFEDYRGITALIFRT